MTTVKHGFYLMLSMTYKVDLVCISSISDIKCLVFGNVYNVKMVGLLGLGCHGLPLERHRGRYTPAISVIILEILESLGYIFIRYLLIKKSAFIKSRTIHPPAKIRRPSIYIKQHCHIFLKNYGLLFKTNRRL